MITMGKDIQASLNRFVSLEGGILLVDKAADWTSFDVVKKVRNLFGLRKVGHAGTLDPSATGLLILCSNRHTSKVHEYQELPKEYIGTMKFGWVTDSLDAETEEKDPRPTDHITEAILREAALRFVGEIEQIPPMYSALKKNGKRLYTLARKGETVEREPRRVQVYNFTINDVRLPLVDFTVTCSKGTYVRSLVHDLGQALGTGAYVCALRRTAIGDYRVEDAWTIDRLLQSQATDAQV